MGEPLDGAALSGSVALVTGASSGIGRHLAEGLAARGMAVAGLSRNGERLAAAMDEVAAATGARTLAVPVGPHVSTFPPVYTDVAYTVQVDVPAATVEAALREGAGPLLENLQLFDVFTGEQLGADQKSLAYSLTFRASDRTLTRQEVAEAVSSVHAAAAGVGAVLRG